MGFSQKKFKLDKSDKKVIGYGMMIGGASLTLGVAFTPLEYTKLSNNTYVTTPYYKQTAQISGLVTGVTLTIGGGITAILNGGRGKPKRNYR